MFRCNTLIGTLFAVLFCLPACTKRDLPYREDSVSNFEKRGSQSLWFEDITAQSGLDFKHDAGATGSWFMPESIGSGGALLDFDNDGRLDIYLIHSAGPSKSKNRLYHQEINGQFRDVSDGSGLDVSGYGMGAAVGDVNNDGLPEVLLTEYGNTRLFLNRSGGKFEDITRASGIDNTRWATAAAFFDYDRDGWLDLVIVNYVDYTETTKCYDTRGAPEYCGPQGLQGTASRLFHNTSGHNKGLRFEDVSVASGLARKTGAGLGVLCADFDGDHWPDILVADDGMPNRLYMNQRNGVFTEEAAQRGIACNAFGSTAANMGIGFGDVDADGFFDVFVTHVAWEQHALWKQAPAGLFQDRTAMAGLATPSRRGTGFGTVLADFDLDGALDLALVNGRIKRTNNGGKSAAEKESLLPGMNPFWNPYAERNQLFANDGTGRFQDISDANTALCGRAAVGRGLACGDIDNDGDLDLLVVNAGGPAELLRNVAPRRGHWLTVRAIDPAAGGRDAYGAEITVTAGARRWARLIQPGYSYLVSNDPRAHFGLAGASTIDRVEIIWPDGTREAFPGGKTDRLIVVRKGTGTGS